MNHSASFKPMCHDQVRAIVQSANRNATNTHRTKSTKSARHLASTVAVCKPRSAVSATASATTVAGITTTVNTESKDAAQRKKVWWRQLVISESLVAAMKSSRSTR